MQEQGKAVVADKATTKNNNKANNGNKVDVAELLRIATTTSTQRVQNTCKIYADKLNFACNSGVENGKRYACKVANNTMLVYADKNGNKAGNKLDGNGNVAGILFATGKAKHSKEYRQAVKNSKVDGSKEFADYTITKQTSNGVVYLIIDLQEHAKSADKGKNYAENKAKNSKA